MAQLNERNTELARYHASVDAMELAYSCRNAPRVYDGRIETDDEGLCLLVHTEKRRVRIPLHDSYFAEPIVDAVKNASEVKVELFGVLIDSRTRLRARLVGVGESIQRGFSDGSSASEVFQRVPATASAQKPLPSSADAYIQAAALAAEDNAPEVTGGALEESYVNETLGYPIDDFQQRSLAVM